jgi:4-hydroxybenzoate polyprenyltransferase
MDVPKKLVALFSATYPHNFPLVLFALLGLVSTRMLTLENAILVCIIAWMPMTTGFVINIIGDWRKDEVNKKNLLIHKDLTIRDLYGLYILLLALSFIPLIWSNWQLKLLVIAEIGLGIVYSLGPRLKDVFVLNYLSLSFIYGVIPPLIGIFAVTDTITPVQMLVVAFVALLSFFSSQIKDFEDIDGDKDGSTLAHKGDLGRKLYVFYHLVFFAALSIAILVGMLPSAFLITLLSIPIFVLFLARFWGAKYKRDYRRLHLVDNLLALLVVSLFAIAFLL